ncbi:class II fructose-1,6-bisphosphate aldolase [Mahella australiensis]|uniref:Fructose-bisphosphate aldolase n=1 Tax=Mahella australiensis (strain DSM 15567 / CIP 107919 / 50-1 BON) TaxID=697281 RepID=F3ZX23_MAHA5|nr:class II fructose-1,6-bisphosphate aldolase [Mahella australiensis]AEE95472.1 fructose-bisphosphate aldolase [Mahella australiensis 50-1 BON]
MLVNTREMLDKAREKGYAIGAFNMSNMEILQAIVQAAEIENAPVIVQASQAALKYAGVDYIEAMGKLAAQKASVPVAIHLDHGTDFNLIMLCIRHGFTSVMIDGSKYQFEENIAITKKVVEIAHAVDVSVEAELGKIGGTEDHITVSEKEALYTEPEEAVRFAKETGVDSLAISIGTAHGPYKGEPKLDFDRLAEIRSMLDIPIVLHGASGVPDESIRKAVERGVCKINIDTEIRQSFTEAVRKILADNPAEYDPRKVLGVAKEAMIETVSGKMRLFGCSGRA